MWNALKSELKHGVTCRELEEMFLSEPVVVPDAAHSEAELRFRALGQPAAGRVLHAEFTVREGKIRPMSVRPVNKKEPAIDENRQTLPSRGRSRRSATWNLWPGEIGRLHAEGAGPHAFVAGNASQADIRKCPNESHLGVNSPPRCDLSVRSTRCRPFACVHPSQTGGCKSATLD